MNLRHPALSLLAGALLATTALAHAGNVPYRTGGIGMQEEVQMRHDARNWPLRMTFSERKGDEFVTGVKLVVKDAKGETLLALDDAGPMTFARLPAGRYEVVASLRGRTETRHVTVGEHGGQDLAFHWLG